ncbi:MAG: hypothetical protein AAF221_08350 [Pseudomonadota bacterium]
MTETTTSGPEHDPLDDIAFEVPLLEGEIMDDEPPRDEEMDQATRALFFQAMSFVIGIPNFIRAKNGKDPLQSLDLQAYGDVGRAASDQACERLAESEALANWLGPMDQFMRDYGAILALGVVMASNVKTELEAIRESEESEETGEAAANG